MNVKTLKLSLPLITVTAVFLILNPSVRDKSQNSAQMTSSKEISPENYSHRITAKVKSPLSNKKQRVDRRQFHQNKEKGEIFQWELQPYLSVSGTVDSVVAARDSYSFSVALEKKRGRFVYMSNPSGELAFIFLNGQNEVYKMQRIDNEWFIQETVVENVFCASIGETYPPLSLRTLKAASLKESTTIESSAQAALSYQSNPGAPTVIYLDFDGETINQPFWHFGPLTVQPAELNSNSEAILNTLKMVAEDFSAFNVNVTNVRSVYDATSSNKRVMCIITPSDTVAPGTAGVAILDSFIMDLVCWSFDHQQFKDVADTSSHEIGHTLNLLHDGQLASPENIEYYDGHSSSSVAWGPLMGAAYNAKIATWSNGRYYRGNNSEDDFAIISSNGLSIRADDHGNTTSNATPMHIKTNQVQTGRIGPYGDIDVFQVTVDDFSKVSFQVQGLGSPLANLDIRMDIYSNNIFIQSIRDSSKENASYEAPLAPGIYEVHIQGDSSGSPNTNTPTGWDQYGSVGAYSISVSAEPITPEQAVDHYSPIILSGTQPWYYQTLETYDGVDALAAGSITNNQDSVFEFTAHTTSISFWYKVSSEKDYDSLTFYVDGVARQTWSGEIEWSNYTLSGLSEEEHSFAWLYNKDVLFHSGSDRAWVDQIKTDETTRADEVIMATTDDGVAAELEFATGRYKTSTEIQPLLRIDPDSKEALFTLNTVASDTYLKLQVSSDLINWETVGVSYWGKEMIVAPGILIQKTDLESDLQQLSVAFSTTPENYQFVRLVAGQR